MKQDINMLLPKGEYKQESFDEFNLRYEGFGKDIYKVINSDLPFVFDNLKLYRRERIQIMDSYAIYDNQRSCFAMQIDPESEVIILWNDDIHVEFGSWTKDFNQRILESIKSKMYVPHSLCYSYKDILSRCKRR